MHLHMQTCPPQYVPETPTQDKFKCDDACSSRESAGGLNESFGTSDPVRRRFVTQTGNNNLALSQ